MLEGIHRLKVGLDAWTHSAIIIVVVVEVVVFLRLGYVYAYVNV
jgi:hypothetical protein